MFNRFSKKPSKSIGDADEDEGRRSVSLNRSRPQTRVVVRPTSNIKHPIIESSSDKSLNQIQVEDKKCNSIWRTNSINFMSKSPVPRRRDNSSNNSSPSKSFKHKPIGVLHKSFQDLKLDDSNSSIMTTSFRQRRRSPIPTPSSLKTPAQPPAGWKDFTSKLSTCPQCKRHFYPYRIKSHIQLCDEQREDNSKIDSLVLENGVTQTSTPGAKHKTSNKSGKNSSGTKSMSASTSSGYSSCPEDVMVSEEEQREYEQHLKQLKKCRRCHRTFFPHRLRVHESFCHAQPIIPFHLR